MAVSSDSELKRVQRGKVRGQKGLIVDYLVSWHPGSWVGQEGTGVHGALLWVLGRCYRSVGNPSHMVLQKPLRTDLPWLGVYSSSLSL